MQSRVCVKNLPSYLKEDRLKSIFEEKGSVTDVKIMRLPNGTSRKFGFIGFGTPKEAKLAIDYFDGIFIDTSKISVEPARPVGDEVLERSWSKHTKASRDKREKEKEKDKTEDSKGKKETKEIDEKRLFVRNLAFSVTEEDLNKLFSKFGTVEDVHLCVDPVAKTSKGVAFVRFEEARDAEDAQSQLDMSIFKGRLIHILPAEQSLSDQKSDSSSFAVTGGSSSFKKKQKQKRTERKNDDFNWNSLYMRPDTVASHAAKILDLPKATFLGDEESGSIAVRMTLGEAQVIRETKEALAQEGVDTSILDSAKTGDKKLKRSDTVLLIKNLRHDVTRDELESIFGEIGSSLHKVVLLPSNGMAIVEYAERVDAKKAFRHWAYRNFKNVPMYVEWAPVGLINKPDKKKGKEDGDDEEEEDNDDMEDGGESEKKTISEERKEGVREEGEKGEEGEEGEEGETLQPTVFVKNLNFSTTEEDLMSSTRSICDIRTVRIHRKRNRQGEMRSLGYGFVECFSFADAKMIIDALNGLVLDGHRLECKMAKSHVVSESGDVEALDQNGKDEAKLVVKNLAFEATKKELRELFSAYGHVRSVRIPKRFDGRHRGFAFIEYAAMEEAKSALEALKDAHLYGRHLVIQWAKTDDSVSEMREKAQKHVHLLAESYVIHCITPLIWIYVATKMRCFVNEQAKKKKTF